MVHCRTCCSLRRQSSSQFSLTKMLSANLLLNSANSELKLHLQLNQFSLLTVADAHSNLAKTIKPSTNRFSHVCILKATKNQKLILKHKTYSQKNTKGGIIFTIQALRLAKLNSCCLEIRDFVKRISDSQHSTGSLLPIQIYLTITFVRCVRQFAGRPDSVIKLDSTTRPSTM